MILRSLFIAISFLLVTSAYGLPAFPGAEGFGSDTVHGSGRGAGQGSTTVYKVTNRNTSGTGSLKACVDSSGPRYCVFEISGYIDLNSVLYIRNPYIYIAGQTAPSPGITLRGGTLSSRTSNVLVRHIRVMPGDGSDNPNTDRDAFGATAFTGETVEKVIFDHVTGAWSTDEWGQIWCNNSGCSVSEITISNSLFYEPLHNSIHSEGAHGFGWIIGNSSTYPEPEDLSFIRNINLFSVERNPRISKGTRIEVINNYVYGYNGSTASVTTVSNDDLQSDPQQIDFIRNYFEAGPQTLTNQLASLRSGAVLGASKYYVLGNLCPARLTDTGSEWLCVSGINEATYKSATRVADSSTVTIISTTSEVKSTLLAATGAGFRPQQRAATGDQRVIDLVQEETNWGIIDSVTEAGGWPTLAQNTRTLEVPSNCDDILETGDYAGYTGCEAWIEGFTAEVQTGEVGGGDPPPPPEPGGGSPSGRKFGGARRWHIGKRFYF